MGADDPDSALRLTTTLVELRPIYGPHLQIQVATAQWEGQACAIGTECTGDTTFIGFMYDLSASPGTPAYSRPAYAHPDCARPITPWQRVPAHSRCQPTVPQAAS